MDSLPRPYTRLPPINRSQSPSFSMKDLVPAPLRSKPRSPLLRSRTSDEANRTKPIQIVGARAGWDYYPPRPTENPRNARSVSPAPVDRQPAPARVRSPRQRYLHIPPEYLNTSQSKYPAVNVSRRPALPIASSMSASCIPQQPKRVPTASRNQIKLTISSPGPRQQRKHVPSMIDYLSLEQLEDLWEAQDFFKGGPVNLPQKPASPMWRIEEDDPRSPLQPGAIHPAFRNHPSIHNSFASEIL
ncbi:hypothetical protein MMC13_000379 [Lambiella insularis]|nr:hypothetical protein [Lambiella insularis]